MTKRCVSRTLGPGVQGKGEEGMTEEKKSFWARLFGGSRSSVREQKVLEYIVYRMNQGANLKDVVGEEYVRRNAFGSQMSRHLEQPQDRRGRPGADAGNLPFRGVGLRRAPVG